MLGSIYCGKMDSVGANGFTEPTAHVTAGQGLEGEVSIAVAVDPVPFIPGSKLVSDTRLRGVNELLTLDKDKNIS